MVGLFQGWKRGCSSDRTGPRGALLPRCGPDAQVPRGQRNVARAVSPTRATPPPRAHAISRLTLLIPPASSFRAAPIQYQGSLDHFIRPTPAETIDKLNSGFVYHPKGLIACRLPPNPMSAGCSSSGYLVSVPSRTSTASMFPLLDRSSPKTSV